MLCADEQPGLLQRAARNFSQSGISPSGFWCVPVLISLLLLSVSAGFMSCHMPLQPVAMKWIFACCYCSC